MQSEVSLSFLKTKLNWKKIILLPCPFLQCLDAMLMSDIFKQEVKIFRQEIVFHHSPLSIGFPNSSVFCKKTSPYSQSSAGRKKLFAACQIVALIYQDFHPTVSSDIFLSCLCQPIYSRKDGTHSKKET